MAGGLGCGLSVLVNMTQVSSPTNIVNKRLAHTVTNQRHNTGSRLNGHSQIDWAVQNQAYNLNWLTRCYDELAFSPIDFTASCLSHLALAIYIYICILLILMLWHRQADMESKGDKMSSSAECRARTLEVWDTKSRADCMPAHKPNELSRIKHKMWTR